MKTNILEDFKICISVPLIQKFKELCRNVNIHARGLSQILNSSLENIKIHTNWLVSRYIEIFNKPFFIEHLLWLLLKLPAVSKLVFQTRLFNFWNNYQNSWLELSRKAFKFLETIIRFAFAFTLCVFNEAIRISLMYYST